MLECNHSGLVGPTSHADKAGAACGCGMKLCASDSSSGGRKRETVWHWQRHGRTHLVKQDHSRFDCCRLLLRVLVRDDSVARALVATGHSGDNGDELRGLHRLAQMGLITRR